MKKIFLASLYLGLLACAPSSSLAAPAPAPPPSAPSHVAQGPDTCGIRYYRDLIGKPVEEARHIGGEDYRIVTDANSGTRNPKRLTVLIDARSNVIQKLVCG